MRRACPAMEAVLASILADSATGGVGKGTRMRAGDPSSAYAGG